MANGVEVDVPVTSSEARLDLLLAEEMAVNQQFLRRFIEPARALTGTDPVSDVVTALVRLNVWDNGGPSCVATDGGENDIDVAVTIGSRTMRVLIQDKVWAVGTTKTRGCGSEGLVARLPWAYLDCDVSEPTITKKLCDTRVRDDEPILEPACASNVCVVQDLLV